EISSNIAYKRGFMGYIIALGVFEPGYLKDKGLIGAHVYGKTDWRYCKKSTIAGNPHRLVFWDGEAWIAVPKAFDIADPMGLRLKGMSVWREESVIHDKGVVKTQFGKKPWPDDVPDWDPKSVARFENEIKPRWVKAINDYWSG